MNIRLYMQGREGQKPRHRVAPPLFGSGSARRESCSVAAKKVLVAASRSMVLRSVDRETSTDGMVVTCTEAGIHL